MTAYNQALNTITLSASGDADTWQYHFVKLALGDDNFNIATGASNPAPIGILLDDPESGNRGSIAVPNGGRVKVRADATSTAIVIGDWLTAGSDGQAVVGSGSAVFGQALKAVASGASVLIDMIWQPSVTIADNTP
jgi:hypothetical protein